MKNKPLIVALIFIPFIFYTIYGIFFPLIFPFAPKQTTLIVSILGTILISFIFWIILNNLNNPIVSKALITGIVSCTITFVLGFIGPMIFYPEANQGPILGFFIAPIGFIAGSILGGIYWHFKLNK